MKKILFWLSSIVLLVVSSFSFTACNCGKEGKVVTGIYVELDNDNYEMSDNIINIFYGDKVDLNYSDFKVMANLKNGKTKEIDRRTGSKEGYIYQSLIPTSYDVTPAGIYRIVFTYEKCEPVSVFVRVSKFDFEGTINWNYETAYIYSGEEKTVEVQGVPEGVVVEYSGVTCATEVGEYTCTATFNCKNSKYKAIPDMTLTWSIVEA